MARESKERKLEVCDWVQEKVDQKLVDLPKDQFGENEDEAVIRATIKDAAVEFGYLALTIKKWYEQLVWKKPLTKVRKRRTKAEMGAKTPAVTKKAVAPAAPRKPVVSEVAEEGMLAEAFVLIGELSLGSDDQTGVSRSLLKALGRKHVETRLLERQIRELKDKANG